MIPPLGTTRDDLGERAIGSGWECFPGRTLGKIGKAGSMKNREILQYLAPP